MDTVSEESSVQSNSGEIDAKSSPTQNGASSVRERPLDDFNSSVEGPGASRSTANGSYLSGTSPRRRVADPGAIQKVEAIVEKVLRSLQGQDESISIALKTKRRSGTASSLPSQAPSSRNQYQLSFPGNTPQEAWRFTVVLRILELVHEALLNNVVVSKRNIYYKDPELFKSQKVVDRYVDILSYTFGIQRQALNVVSPSVSSNAPKV
ncbi:MAG: hypothetical protein Q9202_002976 [Teloschistes flavicans]